MQYIISLIAVSVSGLIAAVVIMVTSWFMLVAGWNPVLVCAYIASMVIFELSFVVIYASNMVVSKLDSIAEELSKLNEEER